MPNQLLSFDIVLFWLINGAHNRVLDAFFGAVTLLGAGWVAAPVMVTIVSLKPPRGRLNRIIVMSAVAITLSGLVNTVTIKPLVNRPRPLTYFAEHPERVPVREEGPLSVHVVGRALRYRSFPSGHTNTAFASATVLIVLYGGWAWLALLPAALVGYSRVYLGVHFPLDVVVGAVLAVAISWPVMARSKYWWREEKPDEAVVR